MKPIRITARFCPFSHLPGTLCLLPGTHVKVQVFPARLHFFRYDEPLPFFSLPLDVQGPVKEFTVAMDLECAAIKVSGKTVRGFMRYRIEQRSEGIVVDMEKPPDGKTVVIPHTCIEHPPCKERLSLGMHKAQDWDLVKRRLDLKEILPIWMRLGQLTPPHTASPKGNAILLDSCRALVKENRKNDIVPAFERLFLAAFDGILVPRLFDTEYQGIAPVERTDAKELASLQILTEGAFLIRSLFIKEEEEALCLLPCVPPEFPSGRLMDVCTLLGDKLDVEWTKKQVRRVLLRPHVARKMTLKFSRHMRSCRVRNSLKEVGQEHVLKEGIVHLDVQRPILIDRFQK